jgi:hypothetical protein
VLVIAIASSIDSDTTSNILLAETLPRWASAEIFDPHTGKWTPTGPMTAPRSEVEYASVLLPDGRVLVPGGYTAPHTPVSSSDLYDPRTGTWTASGSMSVVRAGHSSIVLRGNRGVLVMGGEGGRFITAVQPVSILPFGLIDRVDILHNEPSRVAAWRLFVHV